MVSILDVVKNCGKVRWRFVKICVQKFVHKQKIRHTNANDYNNLRSRDQLVDK